MNFESRDLDLVEDVLTKAFAKVRFDGLRAGGRVAARRTVMTRSEFGPDLRLDRLKFGVQVAYDSDPVGTWNVCAVRSGVIEHTYLRERTEAQIRPGDVVWMSAPDEPNTGRLINSDYDILSLSPEMLARVAGAQPVRVLQRGPCAPAKAQRLRQLLAHLREPEVQAAAQQSSLVAATLADYATATVLSAFPAERPAENTVDRHDAHPATVRRAIAFLEAHLREPLTVGDIAAAAYVTPRAVQLAFQAHLGTTPMRYLQRLRLAGAHEELRRARSDAATVTAIATAWGFAHSGRFAAAYRREYGCAPSETLHR
ncbi:helix-turn-helix transcriptional regulator [Nocardia sp. NPDC050712]|uniref:helix-turn-helix transcriptional regulator n=1 Tax=Nocardia sp. NPDC050712 TaxID=3155518 RepID=UPI0033C88802